MYDMSVIVVITSLVSSVFLLLHNYHMLAPKLLLPSKSSLNNNSVVHAVYLSCLQFLQFHTLLTIPSEYLSCNKFGCSRKP